MQELIVDKQIIFQVLANNHALQIETFEREPMSLGKQE